MDTEPIMYAWRRMTPERRKQALEYRQKHAIPWHGPPHYVGDSGLYLLTAACYEHKPIVGTTTERMAGFEAALLETLGSWAQVTFAWVVLPNHYHALINAPDIKGLLKTIGQSHGRTSYHWNGEDSARKRHVWYRAAETEMKSERHFWATVNYVLHNPVHHDYVERWQEWPYSSATQYLSEVGREAAERRWREYPLLGYGNDWDPPDL